jgi:hypothetical protein
VALIDQPTKCGACPGAGVPLRRPGKRARSPRTGPYFEIWHNGRWYEPPLPMGRLSQTFNMSPYHRSAIA